jgi:hypothetical protein
MVWGLSAPAYAQEWFDATPLFEAETKWLADNVEKETLAEYELRTRGTVQYADRKPPSVGDEISFNTFNIAHKRFERVPAVLRKIGKHCYCYVQKGKNLSDAVLAKISRNFDEKIYPTTTGLFGSEWSPGVDGDPRITLFFLDIQDGYTSGNKGFTAGYFFSGDEYARAKNANSNEREMLYLDLYPANPSQDSYPSVIAHEFQHMIHWHHDPKEFTWLNEAMSQLASYVNGYGHPPQLVSFLNNPNNNMCAWLNENMIANYGQVYAFAYYLMARYSAGGKKLGALLKNVVKSKSRGMLSVTAALKQTGYKAEADAVFRNFCVANFLNDPGFGNGLYGFDAKLKKFRLSPMKKHNGGPLTGKGSVKCWSAQAVNMNLKGVTGPIRLRFTGQNKVADRKYRNEFDVAAVFHGGNNRPIVEWATVKANAIDQTLKTPAGGHPNLMLVVCNAGPAGNVEVPYAQAAGPAEFAYAVSLSRPVQPSRSVASRQKINRSEFLAMVEQVRTSAGAIEDLPPEFSDDPQVQATVFTQEFDRINVMETQLTDAIQAEVELGEKELLTAFFTMYRAESPEGKKKLAGLHRKISDLVSFEVMQNNRQELAEFLEGN